MERGEKTVSWMSKESEGNVKGKTMEKCKARYMDMKEGGTKDRETVQDDGKGRRTCERKEKFR